MRRLGRIISRYYTVSGESRECGAMLWLTRFDGTRFVLNADLVEMMEQTPDTVITLTIGHHLVVKESVENIMRQLLSFRQQSNVPAGEAR